MCMKSEFHLCYSHAFGRSHAARLNGNYIEMTRSFSGGKICGVVLLFSHLSITVVANGSNLGR